MSDTLQTPSNGFLCSHVSWLQEGPKTMVGIATFDSTIHFYNLKRALQQVYSQLSYKSLTHATLINCLGLMFLLMHFWMLIISQLFLRGRAKNGMPQKLALLCYMLARIQGKSRASQNQILTLNSSIIASRKKVEFLRKASFTLNNSLFSFFPSAPADWQ